MANLKDSPGSRSGFLMNLMATEPFDLLHIAAFSSYIAARTTTSPDLSHRLLQREIQVILAFQCWRCYLTAGKHEDTPEAYPLPTEVVIVKVAAGWAHCIAVTAFGEVYTWGWKECVPYGMITGDKITEVSPDKDENDGNSSSRREGFVMVVVTCLIGLQFGHITVHLKDHRERILHWTVPSLGLLKLGFALDFFGLHAYEQASLLIELQV
ncbi:hypothetical protein J5N97_000186 [Dioscorea zingiberensis]|uniref:Uncharacterized protein n=1 Tax=Dioscorea zingiberensis TaxID=325984 RepID=A0A9D5BVI0_9LILI|nr:hypothetical protein J5N97_000186 [Dioscorea zingiberensis]